MNAEIEPNPFKAIATRIVNAENRFIEFVIESIKVDQVSAEKIMACYRKLRILKIDAVGGRFTVTHGIYLEPDVLRNALEAK